MNCATLISGATRRGIFKNVLSFYVLNTFSIICLRTWMTEKISLQLSDKDIYLQSTKTHDEQHYGSKSYKMQKFLQLMALTN